MLRQLLNLRPAQQQVITLLGPLTQLKPILTMDNGKPGTERVRTRQRATKRLLEMLCDVGKIERVAIVHTNAPARVAELRIQAADLLPGDNHGERYYPCHRRAHRSRRIRFCSNTMEDGRIWRWHGRQTHQRQER